MRERPKWKVVVVALGLIAAIAIAVPAFGIQKSLKKAIKKEVSKQIGKAQGPTGAPGSPGLAGAPGSALAYAHVLANGTTDPSGTKDVVITDANVNGFCLQVTTAVPKNIVATVDVGGDVLPGNVNDGVAGTLDPTTVQFNCSPQAHAVLFTLDHNGAAVARPFYVVFN